MKEFFGITEEYRFEWNDLSSFLTVVNVILILIGFWWAPIIGILNCGIGLILAVVNHYHINIYVMNLALIVLNIYFLTL